MSNVRLARRVSLPLCVPLLVKAPQPSSAWEVDLHSVLECWECEKLRDRRCRVVIPFYSAWRWKRRRLKKGEGNPALAHFQLPSRWCIRLYSNSYSGNVRIIIIIMFEHSDGAPTIQGRESQLWSTMTGYLLTSDMVLVCEEDFKLVWSRVSLILWRVWLLRLLTSLELPAHGEELESDISFLRSNQEWINWKVVKLKSEKLIRNRQIRKANRVILSKILI